MNKIDLSGIISFGKYFIGQTKVFNLLLHSGNINEGLVYGQRIAGSGVQYEINIYGSAKLKPILPWLK